MSRRCWPLIKSGRVSLPLWFDRNFETSVCRPWMPRYPLGTLRRESSIAVWSREARAGDMAATCLLVRLVTQRFAGDVASSQALVFVFASLGLLQTVYECPRADVAEDAVGFVWAFEALEIEALDTGKAKAPVQCRSFVGHTTGGRSFPYLD